MSGSGPQQSVNARGPQSSVPPWGGGNLGPAPMNHPHFGPNIGGPNATGNPTQPVGPLTPVGGPQTGGPQTGPLTPSSGPLTPVGGAGPQTGPMTPSNGPLTPVGGFRNPDIGTYGGGQGTQSQGAQRGGYNMGQGGVNFPQFNFPGMGGGFTMPSLGGMGK
jgi:hypothetical protein